MSIAEMISVAVVLSSLAGVSGTLNVSFKATIAAMTSTASDGTIASPGSSDLSTGTGSAATIGTGSSFSVTGMIIPYRTYPMVVADFGQKKILVRLNG
jgi:hypothetical protein